MFGLNREAYLSARIRNEEKLLAEVQEGRAKYVLDRSLIADFAQPIIRRLIGSQDGIEIFELGCGNGKALRRLLENNNDLSPLTLCGASLSPLPEHNLLTDRGIRIFTGIVAEYMPREWEERYDVVLASVVMKFTKLSLAVPEIVRVLKPDGYFIGFEDQWKTMAAVERSGERAGLRSVYTEAMEHLWHHLNGPGEGYPFVFQKVWL